MPPEISVTLGGYGQTGVFVSEFQMAENKEQAVTLGFLAILRHVRDHGITDAVGVVETWIGHVRDPGVRGEMARLLAAFWLARNDTGKTVHYGDIAVSLLPHDPVPVTAALTALTRAGRWAEIIPRGRAALARFGEMHRWHDFLRAAHGHLNQMTEARHHGTRCLELRDAALPDPPPRVARELAHVPVPAFDTARPERNVISFSLYGDDERRIRMAVLNARAARFLYPGWTCHFHTDDTVPAPVVQALGGEGARVLKVQGLPADPYGPFWRFLIADEQGVDRYIVRDTSALLNLRECVAVQEWVRSDRHFHVMRDHFDHAELILPGLWGGVRGALPPIGLWAQRYLAGRSGAAGLDPGQAFLRDQLWPIMRASVLTHDSQFAFGEWRGFPAVGRLPHGCHAGGDDRALFAARMARAR